MRVLFAALSTIVCLLICTPQGIAQIARTMPSATGAPMPSATTVLNAGSNVHPPKIPAASAVPMPEALSFPPKDTQLRLKTRVEINTAKILDLSRLPGLDAIQVGRIIRGRPYSNKLQLLTEGVLTGTAYEKIRKLVVAVPLLPGGVPTRE